MAKTKWWALWDIQSAGSGYDAVGVKTIKKGGTLLSEDISESGGLGKEGPVFVCKLAQVEAEGEEEAIVIAGEAYGARGGVGAVPHAEKELKFFKA